jgi:hypothetical protein
MIRGRIWKWSPARFHFLFGLRAAEAMLPLVERRPNYFFEFERK